MQRECAILPAAPGHDHCRPLGIVCAHLSGSMLDRQSNRLPVMSLTKGHNREPGDHGTTGCIGSWIVRTMPPARPVFWLRPPRCLPACAVAYLSGPLGPLQKHVCPGFSPGSRSPSGLYSVFCDRLPPEWHSGFYLPGRGDSSGGRSLPVRPACIDGCVSSKSSTGLWTCPFGFLQSIKGIKLSIAK